MTSETQRLTFISYSRDDKDFALELAVELKAAGFLVWLDQLDIPTGSRWDDEVQKALEQCEIFMVILTPNSIASHNVKDEIGYVLDSNKRILPVLLENANIPFRLRRFQYVDFTNKSYNEGIEVAKQLLRKLLDEPTGPVPPVRPDPPRHHSREEAKQAVADREEADRLWREEGDIARIAAQREEADRLARAKEDGERIAARRAEAEQIARQKAEALRAARDREQLERRSQAVLHVPETARKASPAQAQGRPPFKFIPILIGGVLGLLFCSVGGFFVYDILTQNTVTPAAVPTTERPPDPVITESTTDAATTQPLPVSTTESVPVVVVEISITPAFFPQEPEQFIVFYWETIIYDKDYELAWSLLTDGFKRRNNPAGFDDWKTTMVKIIRWDRPVNFVTNSLSPSMVTVHIDSIHFYSISSPDNGYFLRDVNYCMIRDENRSTWVIESADVCRR